MLLLQNADRPMKATPLIRKVLMYLLKAAAVDAAPLPTVLVESQCHLDWFLRYSMSLK
jgi:hypothetical protein